MRPVHEDRLFLRFIVFVVVFVFLLCIAGAAAGQTNLVVNGSFEADPCTGSGFGYKSGLVGNAVTGWFIPGSDGTYPWCLQNVNAFSAGPTPYGNQWLVLGEVFTGVQYTIQQTITGLTPGNTYKLSFAIASEAGCCSTVEVSFPGGSSTAAQTFTAPFSVNYWRAWATETMNFVATSSSVTLQFKNVNLSFSGVDLGLDNVDVEAAAPPIQITLVSPPANDQYAITATPTMPTIQATAKVIGVTPDPTPSTAFTWAAHLEINENGGTGPTIDYDNDIIQNVTTTGSGTYTLTFRHPKVFEGGALTLTVTATVNGQTLTAKTPPNLDIQPASPLQIYGTNPQRSDIQSDIVTQVLSHKFHGLQNAEVEDVLQRIACRESGQIQFKASANGGQGPPDVAPDNGIGIMQITQPSPDLFVTEPQVVFNWQTNVVTGLTTYQSKAKVALAYPRRLRRDNKISNIHSYQFYITNTINLVRAANNLMPITNLPAPNFTTTGNLGSDPPDQLLEDAVRGYNGFAGPHLFGGKIVLHEFIPNQNFLETVPDAQLPTLSTNPNVWQRKCSDPGNGVLYGPVESMNCTVRGIIGDPIYVNNVAANPPDCPNGSQGN